MKEGVNMTTCSWSYQKSESLQAYHELEWGKPEYNENKIFEILALESLQSGLKWELILERRENLRKAFLDFDPDKIANFTEVEVEQLMQNPTIIRNRKKIKAIINNAKLVKQMHQENKKLSEYFWNIIHYQPIINHYHHQEEIPKETELSRQIAKSLKKKGFKFVGPVTIYSFMQASGMVDDHLVNCDVKLNN